MSFLSIRLAQRQPECFLLLLQEASAEMRLSVAEALWEAGQARSEALEYIVAALDGERCKGAAMNLRSTWNFQQKFASRSYWMRSISQVSRVGASLCHLK